MEQCVLYMQSEPVGQAQWTRDGLYFRFHAACGMRTGLWRAVLETEDNATLSLGVLIPEEGRLVCEKKISERALRDQGFDPARITRGTITGSAPAIIETAPPMRAASSARKQDTWHPVASTADTPLRDTLVLNALQSVHGLLLRKKKDGAYLAAPFSEANPCPLTPVICLCGVQSVSGNPYYILYIDAAGHPALADFSDFK